MLWIYVVFGVWSWWLKKSFNYFPFKGLIISLLKHWNKQERVGKQRENTHGARLEITNVNGDEDAAQLCVGVVQRLRKWKTWFLGPRGMTYVNFPVFGFLEIPFPVFSTKVDFSIGFPRLFHWLSIGKPGRWSGVEDWNQTLGGNYLFAGRSQWGRVGSGAGSFFFFGPKVAWFKKESDKGRRNRSWMEVEDPLGIINKPPWRSSNPTIKSIESHTTCQKQLTE